MATNSVAAGSRDHLRAPSAFTCAQLVLTKGPTRGIVSKEELVHLDGEVILIAKGGNFRVKLDNGHEVLAKLAGKVRRHRIRVVLGDRVTVADPTRGFIVYRQR
jgi:translation initiation factor IF-1